MSKRRSDISRRDLKKLWGRSGRTCAFKDASTAKWCRIILEAETSQGDRDVLLGEMAHIFGLRRGGPRYRPELTRKELASYANRVLLCPTHHVVIDAQPNTYTPGYLQAMKEVHEAWVRDTLRTRHGRFSHAVTFAGGLLLCTLWCTISPWVSSRRLSDGPSGGAQAKSETVTAFAPIHNRASLAGVDFFDYQESTEKATDAPDSRLDIDGSNGIINNTPLRSIDANVLTTEVWLIQELGLPEDATGLAELRNRLSDNLTNLGLGDLNGDNDITPRIDGNIIRTVY